MAFQPVRRDVKWTGAHLVGVALELSDLLTIAGHAKVRWLFVELAYALTDQISMLTNIDNLVRGGVG